MGLGGRRTKNIAKPIGSGAKIYMPLTNFFEKAISELLKFILI